MHDHEWPLLALYLLHVYVRVHSTCTQPTDTNYVLYHGGLLKVLYFFTGTVQNDHSSIRPLHLAPSSVFWLALVLLSIIAQ